MYITKNIFVHDEIFLQKENFFYITKTIFLHNENIFSSWWVFFYTIENIFLPDEKNDEFSFYTMKTMFLTRQKMIFLHDENVFFYTNEKYIFYTMKNIFPTTCKNIFAIFSTMINMFPRRWKYFLHDGIYFFYTIKCFWWCSTSTPPSGWDGGRRRSHDYVPIRFKFSAPSVWKNQNTILFIIRKHFL